jgi:lysophospholipase L1-like esterase
LRAIVVASMFAVVSVLVLTGGNGGVAGAATATPAFYLDLGASQSVGFQPIGTSRHGYPTNRGYANDLVALEAAKGVVLQLTQLGCPGEATATMISGGNSCYKSPDSQLADAVAFLRAHQNQTGLVTVELGYNNIGACIGSTTFVGTCVRIRVGAVRQQLPTILNALKAAAGPNVTIVGLGHADPFLAWAIHGPAGYARALASLRTMQFLNGALAHVYAADSIPMVDVAAAFKMNQTTPSALGGVGTVPLNVAQACRLTWMCRPYPLSPNMHPNDAGYQAIAAAIAAVLPAPW